jgi:NADPH-dependent glutamate synthase beta subunit-like oxidoreductase
MNIRSEKESRMHIANDNLERIADALDLIIKMVKEDQESSKKIYGKRKSGRR